MPALQRAPGRLGPGRSADEGGPRRRRVDRQRPEGLDLGGPVRRPRHAAGPHRPRRAQAPGHLLLRLRDAPGRRRRPPAQGDDRPRALQRGLHHRRPGGRLRADRRPQQRLGRGQHHPHERAGRSGLGRRQRGRRRAGAAGHGDGLLAKRVGDLVARPAVGGRGKKSQRPGGALGPCGAGPACSSAWPSPGA